MKIRLGIIGPEESLANIMEVAKDYEDVEVISFPYIFTEECLPIIKKNKNTIDQWFFSGPAPYFYSLSKKVVNIEEANYPPLHGLSFFETIMEAFIKENTLLNSFSVDTIEKSEFLSANSTLINEFFEFYFCSYKEYVPAEVLTKFHFDLYQDGKTEVALTTLNAVYQELSKLGVPCYKVKPSKISIKLVLDLLKEKNVSNKYKKAQLSVLGIQIVKEEKSETKKIFSYSEKHKQIDYMKLLVDFSEKIKGSFVQLNDKLSFIYTNKGELDFDINQESINSLSNVIKLQTGLDVRIALGYGPTVLEAEQNLREALYNSKGAIIETDVVKEVITQSLYKEVYEFSSNGEANRKMKSKKSNVSLATISKIKAMSEYYKQPTVTPTDIAQWLKCSERNGRRILKEMNKEGFAELVGEEQSGKPGRPKLMYKISLN